MKDQSYRVAILALLSFGAPFASASVSGTFISHATPYDTTATQFSANSKGNHGVQLQTRVGKAVQLLSVNGGNDDMWSGVSSTAGSGATSATLTTNDLGSMTVTACSKAGRTYTSSTSGRSKASGTHPVYGMYCCAIGACTPTPASHFTQTLTADGTNNITGCAGAPLNGAVICSDSDMNVCGPVFSGCS